MIRCDLKIQWSYYRFTGPSTGPSDCSRLRSIYINPKPRVPGPRYPDLALLSTFETDYNVAWLTLFYSKDS